MFSIECLLSIISSGFFYIVIDFFMTQSFKVWFFKFFKFNAFNCSRGDKLSPLNFPQLSSMLNKIWHGRWSEKIANFHPLKLFNGAINHNLLLCIYWEEEEEVCSSSQWQFLCHIAPREYCLQFTVSLSITNDFYAECAQLYDFMNSYSHSLGMLNVCSLSMMPTKELSLPI